MNIDENTLQNLFFLMKDLRKSIWLPVLNIAQFMQGGLGRVSKLEIFQFYKPPGFFVEI